MISNMGKNLTSFHPNPSCGSSFVQNWLSWKSYEGLQACKVTRVNTTRYRNFDVRKSSSSTGFNKKNFFTGASTSQCVAVIFIVYLSIKWIFVSFRTCERLDGFGVARLSNNITDRELCYVVYEGSGVPARLVLEGWTSPISRPHASRVYAVSTIRRTVCLEENLHLLSEGGMVRLYHTIVPTLTRPSSHKRTWLSSSRLCVSLD